MFFLLCSFSWFILDRYVFLIIVMDLIPGFEVDFASVDVDDAGVDDFSALHCKK